MALAACSAAPGSPGDGAENVGTAQAALSTSGSFIVPAVT